MTCTGQPAARHLQVSDIQLLHTLMAVQRGGQQVLQVVFLVAVGLVHRNHVVIVLLVQPVQRPHKLGSRVFQLSTSFTCTQNSLVRGGGGLNVT